MKNAVIDLIRYAKANNGLISVYDGGTWPVKRSENEREILEAINSVDEATIKITHTTETTDFGKHLVLGIANIVNGLEPDELVADHSDNDYMNDWWKHYAGWEC